MSVSCCSPYGPNLEEAIFCAVEWELLSVKHCRGAEVTWICGACDLTLVKTKDHLHGHLFPLCWDEGERVKVRKLVGGDENSLMGKAESMLASKTKQGIRLHFPWGGRCSAVPMKAGLCHRWGWLGKRSTVTLNIPTPFFTQLCWVISTSCSVALSP